MTDILRKARDTFDELIRMHQLNLELLEQIDVACEWVLSNNIPIPNRTTLRSLLRKAKILLDEVYSTTKSRKLPPFKFDDRNSEELPELGMRMFL